MIDCTPEARFPSGSHELSFWLASFQSKRRMRGGREQPRVALWLQVGGTFRGKGLDWVGGRAGGPAGGARCCHSLFLAANFVVLRSLLLAKLPGFKGRANEANYPLANEQTSKMEVSNHQADKGEYCLRGITLIWDLFFPYPPILTHFCWHPEQTSLSAQLCEHNLPIAGCPWAFCFVQLLFLGWLITADGASRYFSQYSLMLQAVNIVKGPSIGSQPSVWDAEEPWHANVHAYTDKVSVMFVQLHTIQSIPRLPSGALFPFFFRGLVPL